MSLWLRRFKLIFCQMVQKWQRIFQVQYNNALCILIFAFFVTVATSFTIEKWQFLWQSWYSYETQCGKEDFCQFDFLGGRKVTIISTKKKGFEIWMLILTFFLKFSRYLPQNPHPVTVYVRDGVNVDKFKSNSKQVTLTNLVQSTTGRYRCEVSTEAPRFDTVSQFGDLLVVGKFITKWVHAQ